MSISSVFRASILALVIPACAHAPVAQPWNPTPTTFGFYAVQCMPVRPVYCLVDEDMNAHECDEIVGKSVTALNEAAGRTLLEYKGTLAEPHLTDAYMAGALVVVAKKLDEPTLGVTVPQQRAENGTVCITKVAIAIDTLVIRPQPNGRHFNPWQIVMHELCHAVGAMHTDTNSGFSSIMDPSVSTGMDHFTPADKKALRGVYEKAGNR